MPLIMCLITYWPYSRAPSSLPQVAGSVSVALLSEGRVTCNMLMGRRDVLEPDVMDGLPDACHNATSLKARSALAQIRLLEQPVSDL